MNPLETSWEIFLGTIFALVCSMLGTLARLAHEHSHGIAFTWPRVLLSIPAALIMGVIGHATGEYLFQAYGFPDSTGGALAGALGYLGPTVINDGFAALLSYWRNKHEPTGKGPSQDGK